MIDQPEASFSKFPASHREINFIRVYYFLMIGGTGMFQPFVSLFYRQRGLTGVQIGLLGTVGAIAGLLAAPVWGQLSDRSSKPSRLLQAALVGTAICMLLLTRQTSFIWIPVVIAFDALINCGIDPLSNMQALSVVDQASSAGFGSIRLWGSLGWALLALFGGWLIEHFSLTAPFFGYAISMIICSALIGWISLGKSTKSATYDESNAISPYTWKTILKDRSILTLACALIVTWLTASHFHRFEAIYLTQLGARETLIGLVNTVGALIELPAMFLADRLIKRLGTTRILEAAFILQAISMIFVVIYPSVTAIFLQRLVYGVAYSFLLISSVLFITEHAPINQKTTTLAIISVTLSNLVQIFAAPLGGAIFDFAGAYWLYAVGLVGNIIGWMIFRWGSKMTSKRGFAFP